MDRSDNQCDYNKIILYNAGEFNAKYKSNILPISTKLLIEPEKDFVVKNNYVSTFLNGEYSFLQVNEDVTLYRVFGVYKDVVKSYRDGRFFTTEFAESKIDVKMRLALLPEWNTRMYEAKVKVPCGTKLYYGIAGPQIYENKMINYPGGAEQIIIDDCERRGINNWIEGYRYVTARQLNELPQYPYHNIREVIHEKNRLHPILCPKCKGTDVTKNKTDGYIYICNVCNYVW